MKVQGAGAFKISFHCPPNHRFEDPPFAVKLSFSTLMEEDLSRVCVVGPVRGMESVIATVSGYHGSERFNLIKLISHAGASYVGKMTSSTTHLICWKFEGSKYNFAKRFDTIVVNHKWIEDCIKLRKRIPEHPYMLQSGEEVGPLLLQVPQDAEARSKKRRVLSDQSNFSLESITRGVPRLKDFKEDFVTGSSLLEKKHTKSGHTSRRVSGENRDLLEDEELIGPSARSMRKRNNLSKGNGSSARAESSHRGRKLVKKYNDQETSNGNLAYHDEDCYLIEPTNPSTNAPLSEEHHNSASNLEDPEIRIGSGSFHPLHDQANDDFEDIENPEFLSRDVYSADVHNVEGHSENLAADSVKVTQTDCSVMKSASSNELSCVICWTDFSSTRGVLPCGHRFCYSCIRNWADHMASSRKASTCPLCKTSFLSITKVEEAVCSDQKIYSQTIPLAQSAQNVYFVADHTGAGSRAESSAAAASVCTICHSREPEDLLVQCHLCQTRRIHTYCLDPPLLPWTCTHCKDLQMLYYRTY